MLWEELTSEELAEAAKSELPAILPVGSLEKHGPQLPLGTDALNVFNLVRLAAEKEKAVVLPPLYYAMVKETRHFPEAISLSPETLQRILGEICDEVHRNEFKKILIVNRHGGNISTLSSFVRDKQLSRGMNYVICLTRPAPIDKETMEKITEGKRDGHGGIRETSMGLYFPDWINLEKAKGEGRISSFTSPTGSSSVIISFPKKIIYLWLGSARL